MAYSFYTYRSRGRRLATGFIFGTVAGAAFGYLTATAYPPAVRPVQFECYDAAGNGVRTIRLCRTLPEPSL